MRPNKPPFGSSSNEDDDSHLQPWASKDPLRPAFHPPRPPQGGPFTRADLEKYRNRRRHNVPADASATAIRPDADGPPDSMEQIAADLLHHVDAIHTALGSPVYPTWLTPLGGPTAADIEMRYLAAVHGLCIPRRASSASLAATVGLLARWGESVPGWLECAPAHRPLVALVQRLLTRYYPHQIRLAVPTVFGAHGSQELTEVVRECTNPRGVGIGAVDILGTTIRHGDPMVGYDHEPNAPATRWFVRAQQGDQIGLVAGDTQRWVSTTELAAWRVGWVDTTSQVQGRLRGSIALAHPAVSYALVILQGAPRAVDAVTMTDLLP